MLLLNHKQSTNYGIQQCRKDMNTTQLCARLRLIASFIILLLFDHVAQQHINVLVPRGEKCPSTSACVRASHKHAHCYDGARRCRPRNLHA